MNDHRSKALLALTPIAERAIEGLLFDDQTPVVLASSVAEADEMEREAGESNATAALVSPQLSGLTAGHCARSRAAGLRLIGLALDDRDRDALHAIGIDRILTSDASPEELADALRDDRPPESRASRRQPDDQAADLYRSDAVLAVIGSKGAPGASECAASLAARASARWPTLLVELDTLGGDLDLRIGTDPQRGSLLGVLRATEADQGLGDLLERWVFRAQGWPAALVGPPDAHGHERANAGDITRTLQALARQFPVVVCDVGFQVGGGDIAGGHVHREAIVSASAVVAVIGAREGQLRHGLDQLDTLVDDLGVAPERTRVVVNGVGIPGAAPRREIEAAITDRLADRGLAVDAWLPWDRRAARRAVRAGVPLAVARRRGGYARAVRGLVNDLFLPARPAARRRKRRLRSRSQTMPRRSAKPRDEEVSLPWRA